MIEGGRGSDPDVDDLEENSFLPVGLPFPDFPIKTKIQLFLQGKEREKEAEKFLKEFLKKIQ